MRIWSDILLAWVSLIPFALILFIWALRVSLKKNRPQFLIRFSRWTRRHHKLIGIVIIAAGLGHGLLSSESVFTLNFGTVCWAAGALLGIGWLLRKKFENKQLWLNLHRAVTVAFAALTVIHIVDVGGFLIDDLVAGKLEPAPSSAPGEHIYVKSSEYADGVYTGTADGYRPGIVVEVVIEEGRITSVSVIEHHEKGRIYWGGPVSKIPPAIVEAQSADVDIITGATMTCQGIMRAAEDALRKAEKQ